MLKNRSSHIKVTRSAKMRDIYLTLLLGVLVLINPSANGQDYGLGFYGSDTVKDKRTWLDLNPGDYFSFSEYNV